MSAERPMAAGATMLPVYHAHQKLLADLGQHFDVAVQQQAMEKKLAKTNRAIARWCSSDVFEYGGHP